MPKQIERVLSKMENLLVAAIPKAIKDATLQEPCYCLRIWYNGTDSDETAIPWLMMVKESTRIKFLREHGPKAPYYVWSADEATEPSQSFNLDIDSDELVELYGTWYSHLCDLEDDEELQPFREMTQRVASKLNSLDWAKITQVTDDFVVFPADGAHVFCDDVGDLTASVSAEQLELLKSRNLLNFVE